MSLNAKDFIIMAALLHIDEALGSPSLNCENRFGGQEDGIIGGPTTSMLA